MRMKIQGLPLGDQLFRIQIYVHQKISKVEIYVKIGDIKV